MNRWHNQWFNGLHAHSKLLYIHISDNCDKQCWFNVSMSALRVYLNPLTDPEIKAAFKEISSMCEITPDKKKLRLKACNKPEMLPFGDFELKERRIKFIPPTETEIKLIIKDPILASLFMSHYTANGWKVGRNKMVDWKAAANIWKIQHAEKTDKATGQPESKKPGFMDTLSKFKNA